ncbi:Src kinase-associated phosphoprotein 2-B [Dufourea novaeangliae]|uniref:Src kinase-associated phosphoprotein 2-B n=1 Tax=Dufourea novaeangliae TaxID=178035 RepID=A0A154P0P2_DUFNO|nr:Src kinase-associated phosphoprotein 2-B [Dufourea novaeangliae]
MGLDHELNGILRELVQFLECLREVKLPVALESIRDNLLTRSKDTLTMFMVERTGRPTSPEPYLNMSPVAPKGLVTVSRMDGELQEYVGVEEQPRQKQQQDYYESFQTVESNHAASVTTTTAANTKEHRRNKSEEIENALMEIYSSFPAVEARDKSQKCGPLFRKEGKKLFVFEQYRSCWVGLVGTHLLIYGNDRENRPCTVLPIRGYMARAAPNVFPRDQRRSASAFEMFRPGNRTFQFVARTPKDMEQWVAKICDLNQGNETTEYPKDTIIAPLESNAPEVDSVTDTNYSEEQYQDVGCTSVDKSLSEDQSVTSSVINNDREAIESSSKSANLEPPNPSQAPTLSPTVPGPAPRLPARIPRRLPSLPVRDQNTASDEKLKKNVEAVAERSVGKQNSRGKASHDTTGSSITATRSTDVNCVDERTACVSYDNVESLVSSPKSNKNRRSEKTGEPTKSPQKKSFLDRVRSRKESPRKTDKHAKGKILTPPAPDVQELPTYEDVFGLTNTRQVKRNPSSEEDESEYTCPPPPRPIYGKPPTIVDATDQQEFYDDVTSCRQNYREEVRQINHQRITTKLNYTRELARSNHDESVPCENVDRPVSQLSFDENEHYKIPRGKSNHRQYPVDQQEELYDDIAILAEFTARQKESLGKKEGEETTRIYANVEKRSWNRFVNGKKLKPVDTVAGPEANRRNSIEAENTDELAATRMNTFQKLISKMENSLSKTSVKATPTMLPNKLNLINDA